jgi:hypothetical protein
LTHGCRRLFPALYASRRPARIARTREAA